MNVFFWRKIIPRIAGVLAVLIVNKIPALEGAEEAVTSALLAVWGVFEIAFAAKHAKRQELVADMQRVLQAEGVYDGAVDGRFGPKTDRAIRRLASK